MTQATISQARIREGKCRSHGVPNGVRGNVLPGVIVKCPTTGRPVWTGVTISATLLAELDDSATFSFRCGICNELHAWTKEDAWLGEGS